ncbi:MAG TPA: alpha/beta hydrolase [Rhodanobacteraceae bacterium]|nr:alpha/beta hydrolase [Rhodanobacteraceae bacterium]
MRRLRAAWLAITVVLGGGIAGVAAAGGAAHTSAVPASETLRLWPGIAPGSEHWTQKEVIVRNTPVGTVAINVVTPTLTAYLPPPSRASGTAVIIAPGGYCVALALSAEGSDVARWLQSKGIAAFVLKYRTREKRQQGVPTDIDMDAACRYGIADAIEAVKRVRREAAKWHVARHRVGIIGFSAGGMVASGALLQADAGARPDFAALIYGAPFGAMPAIPADLPPIFMAWAQDDALVRDQLQRFRHALLVAGNRPETHIYRSGGHGFAMKHQGTTSDHWAEAYLAWLAAQGLLRPGALSAAH